MIKIIVNVVSFESQNLKVFHKILNSSFILTEEVASMTKVRIHELLPTALTPSNTWLILPLLPVISFCCPCHHHWLIVAYLKVHFYFAIAVTAARHWCGHCSYCHHPTVPWCFKTKLLFLLTVVAVVIAAS